MRLILLAAMIGCAARAQEFEAGRKQFESRCAGCHGADGGGGEHAPSIVEVGRRGGGAAASEKKLRETITNGIPGGAWHAGLRAGELTEMKFDRQLHRRIAGASAARPSYRRRSGAERKQFFSAPETASSAIR